MKRFKVLADVVLTFCLLIGLSAVVIGFNRLPKRWEKCTGSVLSSGIGDNAEGTKQVAHVEYTYVVDGVSYEGEASRYWWKDVSSGHPSRRIARQFVSRRPAGASTVVFYDPTDPSKSTLHERRYETPRSYTLKFLFRHTPWSQLVIALFYIGFFASPFARRCKNPARRWPLLVPAMCWCLYGCWEWSVPSNANIRVDLLLIWPILLVTSIAAPVLLLFITIARLLKRNKERLNAAESHGGEGD